MRGDFRIFVKHANHFLFFDADDRGIFDGGCGRHADRLRGETAFAKKCIGLQNGNHAFLSAFGEDAQLDPARLEIEYGIRRIPLGKEGMFFVHAQKRFTAVDFREKRFWIKRRIGFRCHKDIWEISLQFVSGAKR